MYMSKTKTFVKNAVLQVQASALHAARKRTLRKVLLDERIRNDHRNG
jgi:hypothetical protein